MKISWTSRRNGKGIWGKGGKEIKGTKEIKGRKMVASWIQIRAI
jgi:hypothetical protein